jgi:glycine/D-amino acid oxidase-like deaminating enzyme
MKVILIEAAQIGMGASGVNAGTLSLQIKRVALMPYALKGHEIWSQAGDKVGFKESGGITLAFTEREAEILEERMAARIGAGAPIEMISSSRARELEPHLADRIVAASYCHSDGYANSSMTGSYYREQLKNAGVTVLEMSPVEQILTDGEGVSVTCSQGIFRAKRAVLATGAWTKAISARLGVHLPINVRINTVSVTERMPKLAKRVIGHATGLLTLKQSTNGTVLIGGGWQGVGTPEAGRGHVVTESLTNNLRLAQYALPELADARLVRCWTGFEANSPDFLPMAGPLPGAENLFVLCCVRGGYTIGPYIGRLMGDLILGRELEQPLFDPVRFLEKQ